MVPQVTFDSWLLISRYIRLFGQCLDQCCGFKPFWYLRILHSHPAFLHSAAQCFLFRFGSALASLFTMKKIEVEKIFKNNCRNSVADRIQCLFDTWIRDPEEVFSGLRISLFQVSWRPPRWTGLAPVPPRRPRTRQQWQKSPPYLRLGHKT